MMSPRKIIELSLLLLALLSIRFIGIVLTKALVLESISTKIRCIERERQALLNFKKELIDDYGLLSSWGDEENKRECCEWRGVRCHNVTNIVVKLDLRVDVLNSHVFHSLSGNISPSLVELRDLNYLDLSLNNFRSIPFPRFIGSLNELRYLNLSYTYFRGAIPPHIGNLTKLRYLDLGGSTHDGLVPNLDWISHGLRSLEYLDLALANLSMVTNWFQVLGTLPSIKELHLSDCDLPQIINPSSLPSTNLSTSLSIIDLSWNRNLFSNNSDLIFNWFLNLSTTITSLDISSTNLDGSNKIPYAFQNMETLANLDLSGNMLEEIPNLFGNMSNLVELKINSNSLNGLFSKQVMNLFGPLESKLQYLDLGLNSLSGPLPNMTRFSFLTTLILQKNQLNETIQEGFLQLPNLVELDLSWNHITGPVPNLSFSKRSLSYLYLNNNMFNGALTESIGDLSKMMMLTLGSNHLDGTITEAHVANLSRLQWLDLSSNSMLIVKWNISNFVPPFQLSYMNLASCKLGPQFSNWLQTQKELVILDISNTQFSDTVSNLLTSLSPTLEYLNASNNQISGFVPYVSFSISNSSGSSFSRYPVLKQEYKTLDLSRNKILGSIHFLCNSTSLIFVDLSDNLLSSPLPDCFANFDKLQHLNLANNHFHGKIPSSFGHVKTLYSLHLQNNNFAGEIPTSMRNCKSLMVIELGENRLTGEVPSWIGGNLPMLMILVLRSNTFNGSIPSNLCNLQHIRVLDLSSNNISGEIPKCLNNFSAMKKQEDEQLLWQFDFTFVLHQSFSILPKLESADMIWKGAMWTFKSPNLAVSIDLSSNNLVGEIPSEITELGFVLGLNFSRNNLVGPIPQDIGNLKLLNVLDLSRNHISGAIPTSLSELSHLGILDLSYNNLSGRIPVNDHSLTFDESTYAGNLGLCGPPLNKSCWIFHHDIDYDEDGFINGGFFISLGIGFFVGFWGILGSILFNKTFRYSFSKVVNNIDDFIYVRVELSKLRFRRQFLNV